MGNDVHADVHEISGRPLAERARVLLEINNAIVSHLDLAQVLNAVSACLRREINHDFAGLALYDACAGALRNLCDGFEDSQVGNKREGALSGPFRRCCRLSRMFYDLSHACGHFA